MAKTNHEKQTSVAAVEVYEELTLDEERERHRLELRVESAFYQAGKALAQLRDQRLYRSTHRTFEEYCHERFGFSRRHPYRLIDAANVVEQLEDFCVQIGHILPGHESICRPMVGLQPQEKRTAWQQIMQQTGGKQPTGRIVKSIVERLKPKPQCSAANFCEVGDVFILQGLVESERKYNGCWAIATDTHGITVGVDVHDGTLRVKPENLRRIDSPEVHRSLPAIHRRIKRLRKRGKLDRSAEIMLSHFGKQTYLTSLEERIFRVMEQEYRVDDDN